MVFGKFRGIWKLITARQAFLVYEDRDGTDVWGVGYGNLGTMMALSIEMKKAYNQLLEMITAVAIESGELHALEEMKQAIEKLEK